jgi:HEAT repeat protein
LPYFDDERARDRLLAMVADPDPAVRAAVAGALGRAGHPSQAGALAWLLDDTDPWVRYVCLKSIAASGVRSALPLVLACLQNDPAPHVRLKAIDVIGALVPPDALNILEPLIQSANDDVAASAIGRLRAASTDRKRSQSSGAKRRRPCPWRRLAAIDALTHRPIRKSPAILQVSAATDVDADVAAAAVAR